MFNKILIGAVALGCSFTGLPTAAEAHGPRYVNQYGYSDYDRGYDRGGYYDQGYSRKGYYGRGRPVRYNQGYYVQRYPQSGYYDQSYRGRDRYYDRRDYGRYDNGYYGRSRDRCGSGTTGLIVGGAGGALLGREIGRGSRRGYYGRRGSGTTGALIGGVAGALIGRSIDRNC